MGRGGYPSVQSVSGWATIGVEPGWLFRMSDDPIASDPLLLYTWTRIIIALVGILAFAIGMEFDFSQVTL